jgi:hypothetical protein
MRGHLLLIVVLLGSTGVAHAQDQAAAEALFKEGRALMKSGDYAAACAKFEASEKLDGGLGTLMNLGACYEKLGRTASAWARYTEAAQVAAKTDDKREAGARERVTALAPKLPYLKIHVTATAPSIVVKRDDTVVDPAALDVEIPVDPGEHVISAEAPDRAPFRVTHTIAEGAHDSVEVPELAMPLAVPPPPVDNTPRRRWARWVPWAVVGGGVAFAVAGAIFLWRSGDDQDTYDSRVATECMTGCSGALADELHGIQDRANLEKGLAIGGLAVGGAALVTGAVLVIMNRPTRPHVDVSLGAHGASIVWSGRF